MPIAITCSGCGKRLKAKDTLAGRTVPCPACGAKLVIGSLDDAAAEMLLDDVAPPPAEPEPPRSQEEAAPATRIDERPRSIPVARRDGPVTKAATERESRSLPPLTTKDPPLWLRHLHWLLVLSLIPLAVSLLQAREEDSIVQRLIETIGEAPEDSQRRAVRALGELEEGKGSEEAVFAALPDHKLRGALFPRDTWRHWLFTLGAAVLFFAFLLVLGTEGSAAPLHLLGVGLFTATVGIVFLLIVQAVAMWTQGVIMIPSGIIGILFWIVKLIGFSYRAAADPENGFVLSFLGYTLGVGLCEELCKALPVIVRYRTTNGESWRGAFLWGLASGAGFGLAEGVIYAGDFYNGIHGIGIYLVRNISCVALHALWTGSAAIMIHQKQHWFQQEIKWHDWLARCVFVVAVPAVLHGLYDTLLKKEMNAPALGVAVLSFGYLAFQISRLRGTDDQAAHQDMLREYQRRRNAMAGR